MTPKAIVTHNNLDWKLLNEKKNIDNYTCYKAVATYAYYSERDNNTYHLPVEAWYTPELNFPFGPNGQGGLPGLILEYKFRNVVYGAKEIRIFKKEIEMPALSDYTQYTFEEYEKILSNELMFKF